MGAEFGTWTLTRRIGDEATICFALTSTWHCRVLSQKNILRPARGGGRWRALVRLRPRRAPLARVLRHILGNGRVRVRLFGRRFAGDFFRSPWPRRLTSPRQE